MNEILTTLRTLPKELLEYVIFQLMTEGKITYHDLTQMHIEHLENLRKGQSEHYNELRGRVVHMYSDYKQNIRKHLKDTMHYLLDCGEINTTHEDIDRKYGK